jgi:hypothetical protein
MANPRPKAGPGRPKGRPNKLTVELKQALMQPFNPKKFATWANKRPDLYFTQIVVKLLPKDLNIRTIKSIDDLTDEEKIALAEDLRKKFGDAE